MTTQINDETFGLIYDLQRSVRYHRLRDRFFQSCAHKISFLSLLSGSSVIVTLLAQGPDWLVVVTAALIAVLQAIDLIGGLAGKARLHSSFATDYAAIERELAAAVSQSSAKLKTFRHRYLEIEMREPPVKRYLDLICHNQVARAHGSDDVENLTWYQRTFAQWLNGNSALHTG